MITARICAIASGFSWINIVGDWFNIGDRTQGTIALRIQNVLGNRFATGKELSVNTHKEGQSYLYIASPVWCKEDAIQYLLDLTPGKKSLITRNISKEQVAALPLNQPAGILVVRDKSGTTGIAYVLFFNWELANRGTENKLTFTE
jgi:hypothetical protein